MANIASSTQTRATSSIAFLSAHKVSNDHIRDMEIGDRIRIARKAAGLTQVRLAALLGVDKSAVAQWEAINSRKGITTANLVRVADALGVRVSKLTEDQSARESVEADDDHEVEVLKNYRRLPALQKDMYRQMLRFALNPADTAELKRDPTCGKRIAS